MITSSNPKNFIDSDIPEANISPTNSPTNSPAKSSIKGRSEAIDSEEHDHTIPEVLYHSSISTLDQEFAYAQIGSKQIQFMPDINVYKKSNHSTGTSCKH